MSLRSKLLNALDLVQTFDTPIYVVTYNGRRLKMASGKSSWGSISAAKNALRNRLPNIANYREQLPAIKELEDEGIIEYIKL